MPVYDYDCPDCGPFTTIRPMRDYAHPAPCPRCAEPAPRGIALPAIPSLDPVRRHAHATNERASHAPKRSTAHPSGCACCKPKAAKPSSRPWMISH